METIQSFISAEEERALRSLHNHPGFLTLLRLLEADLKSSEESLAVAKNPVEAVRMLRHWQILRRVLETFIVAPEKIFQSLALSRAGASVEDPTIPAGQNYYAGTQDVKSPPPRMPGRPSQLRPVPLPHPEADRV